MSYLGNEPGVGSFIVSTERFNGTGACTQFTITQTGISDANAIEVIVSSVQQDPINSYSIASGVITFTEAPPSGTQNIIVTYRATTVITYSNVTASQLADGSITATKLASGVLPTATANSAASYANSAFTTANTAANNTIIASSYANSAFLVANTPTHVANSAASYANSAFLAANTTSNNTTSASLYANSGFAVANSAASYANGAFTKANSVVTSIAAGSGISVSGATGAVTVSSTGGTVTSVATGNGLSGGTITSSGTLQIAAPSYGSVGSYVYGFFIVSGQAGNFSWNNGDIFSAGVSYAHGVVAGYGVEGTNCGTVTGPVFNLTGQWRLMTKGVNAGNSPYIGLMVRVS